MNFGGAVEQVPGERTGLSATRNAEIFAAEGMLSQRLEFFLQKFCRIKRGISIGGRLESDPGAVVARPGCPERIGPAPRRR